MRVNRAHVGIKGQDQERQHDVNHANQRSRRVVHKLDRFADQAEIDSDTVHQPLFLKQNKPCIGAYEKACPERDQHADHADVGPFPGNLRHEVSQRIAKQCTEECSQDADLESCQKDADIGLRIDHPLVILERE